MVISKRGWVPRTILGQLLLGTVLLQISVLTVFLWMSMRSQMRTIHRHDMARIEAQARLLARLSVNPLRRGDRAELGRLAEAMRSSTSVVGARITDMQGNVLATSEGGGSGLDADETYALNRQDRVPHFDALTTRRGSSEGMAEVMVDGQPAAVVWLLPDEDINLRSLNAFVSNALVYASCALLADFFLIGLLARSVSRPLRILNRATESLSRDPEALGAFPLPVTTRNEAGRLTQSFNAMVHDLEVQRSGLRETLALLDSMLGNAPIGFAFFDRKHRYVRINEFLSRISERPAADHLGRTMHEMYVDQDLAGRIEEVTEQVFRTGEVVHDMELTGNFGDPGLSTAKRVWICNFYPVRTGEHVRWVGLVVTEVTERARAEEAMRRSEKLAAAGRLAASIAHEINNPLESVTNLLFLLQHHPSLDPEALEYAALAQRELSRVGEITQQTLRFYRSSSRPEMVRLVDVVNSVLALHTGRMQSAGVRVERRVDATAEIFGFTGELRQLLANLVGNAVDAMSPDGLLRIRVRKATLHGVEGVRVTVADTGTGMSEEVRQRIFEPFYTTKEATGTGLGLWVSAEIVEKHQGVLRLRSSQIEAGSACSGTVFSIFFPQQAVSEVPVIVLNASR
ncbi:sensor histidine kinase [Terriglobus saanensis]|uniref:histidine kinase n=1 Tax=Terriglobus saanensis (strain ATCC BAA-1853 / DSM 23119 / SP1PR4) TaxID=401053 RepID=E8UZ95_TERSS|nr:ATP-binding protein [Terriglobus saanensis]ADV82113.1 multi-sensor signal transduction histidine kinase [Terriglobus saanensis SP1PR4]